MSPRLVLVYLLELVHLLTLSIKYLDNAHTRNALLQKTVHVLNLCSYLLECRLHLLLKYVARNNQ